MTTERGGGERQRITHGGGAARDACVCVKEGARGKEELRGRSGRKGGSENERERGEVAGAWREAGVLNSRRVKPPL